MLILPHRFLMALAKILKSCMCVSVCLSFTLVFVSHSQVSVRHPKNWSISGTLEQTWEKAQTCKPSLRTYFRKKCGLLFQSSKKTQIVSQKLKDQSKVTRKWQANMILNFCMVLVNRILYMAKRVNISKLQNWVCGQIQAFLMSAPTNTGCSCLLPLTGCWLKWFWTELLVIW